MTIDHERTAPDDDTPAEGESLDPSDDDVVDIEDLDTDETTEDVEETETSDEVLDVEDLDTDEAIEADEDPDVETDEDVDVETTTEDLGETADVDVETTTEDLGETADVEDIDTSYADADEDLDAVDEDEAEVDPVADAAQGYFERTDATDAPEVTDVPDELEAPEDTPVAAEPAPATFATDGPFLPDTATFQQRWDGIQIGFVDEPLEAVENAGDLVAEVLDELTSSLAARREELESQWRGTADISTEDLRVVFQAYRALFKRIVL